MAAIASVVLYGTSGFKVVLHSSDLRIHYRIKDFVRKKRQRIELFVSSSDLTRVDFSCAWLSGLVEGSVNYRQKQCLPQASAASGRIIHRV